MATLGASMVTLLTDNWAGAGAAPTFGFLIDYQKDLAGTEEQVLVRLPIYEEVTPINDNYSNFKFTIQLRVKSTVSEDRLKVLTDETIRILNTYAITGITRQFAKRGENTSDRKRQVFSYDVWAICEEHMSTGGTSYSSPGAGDVPFPANVTIAGTLGVTGDATVANLITAGDVDGVDISAEPARITAEIAAAVATENELSEMNDVVLTAPADNEFLAYHNATSKWINQTRAEAGIADGDIDHDALTNFVAAEHKLEAAIDHDALTNFAANEHFLKTTVGLDDLDDCGTLTGAYLQDLLMFGSANKAWTPCVYSMATVPADVKGALFSIANVGANNPNAFWTLPLPCARGGLKLYIDDVKITLAVADAVDDYITLVRLAGIKTDGTSDTLISDATDLTASGTHTVAFATQDCSGYEQMIVNLNIEGGAAAQIVVSAVLAGTYYAA